MSGQLDFSKFYSNHADERDQLCRDLIAGLSKNGWVRLINHDVPTASIDRVFEMVRILAICPFMDTLTDHFAFRAIPSTISRWRRSSSLLIPPQRILIADLVPWEWRMYQLCLIIVRLLRNHYSKI